MMVIKLLVIALLIGLTGFFVAIEFAIVKVRPSRIDELILKGKKGAVSAKRVVTHLDEYLSACQLGITVTALGLGWLGEPTVEKLLHPLLHALHLDDAFAGVLSVTIAFAAVTFFHVVVGELAPKSVAIQKAEAIALLFAVPIIWFNKIMYPFIWLLNSSARFLVGIFGLKPASEYEGAHSEAELRLLLSESYQKGEINQNEFQYVNNIFEFDERIAKEIMVPRREISSVPVDEPLGRVFDLVRAERFSRYPVVDGDKDNILGILNVKALLTAGKKEEWRLEQLVKPAIHVIETIPIHDLLVKMQTERSHMAILIDEYGGTSGLVTVEDIMEEIVGEVRDEFDAEEVADIRKMKDNEFLIAGKVLVENVNKLLGTNLSDPDIDTIGGWFLTQNHDAKVGEAVEAGGYVFTVSEMEGYQILYLNVKKH
ncbi:hemolysin family protein [Neobacillus sp. NRS-1170]|uniref:hemolysin family protein n=1 Tax=Neobacillus sp. NRS-1170 TaxID=3233898 RepID=UPI003D2E22BB